MKSAYELAMERLEKSKPTMALSDEQKRELAERWDSHHRRVLKAKKLTDFLVGRAIPHA